MQQSVIIDTASGHALIGTTLVPVRAAGPHGEIQVGGSSGPILRPLTFGERTRLVTRAAVAPTALDSLCSNVLQTSLVQPGQADRLIQEILALLLAGADQEAPPFAETALRVTRAAGWELRQLYEAEAVEVDRLAIYLGGRPHDSGWTQIVFAGSEESLESLRRNFAEQLLRRVDPFADTQETEPTPPVTSVSSAEQRLLPVGTQQPHSVGERGEAQELEARGEEAFQSRPFGQVRSTTPPMATRPTSSDSMPHLGHSRLRVPLKTLAQRASTPATPTSTLRTGQTTKPPLHWTTVPHSNGLETVEFATPEPSQRSPQQTVSSPLPLPARPRQLLRSDSGERRASATEVRVATQAIAETRPLAHTFVPHVRPESPTDREHTRTPTDWPELADALAELLDHEADMRGVAR